MLKIAKRADAIYFSRKDATGRRKVFVTTRSGCHKAAVEAVFMGPATTRDDGKLLPSTHATAKARNVRSCCTQQNA